MGIMTETAKVEETNGKHAENGDMSELDKGIYKQVSHYFGDFNLPRDKFLSEQVKTDEGGWVGIDVMFKALQKSEEKLIEVDLENKKVRRNPEIPLPEIEDDETKKTKTIYLKGFEKTNTINFSSDF